MQQLCYSYGCASGAAKRLYTHAHALAGKHVCIYSAPIRQEESLLAQARESFGGCPVKLEQLRVKVNELHHLLVKVHIVLLLERLARVRQML